MTEQEKLKFVRRYLVKWKKMLCVSGVNSKGMVKNDIQYVLNKIDDKEVKICKS